MAVKSKRSKSYDLDIKIEQYGDKVPNIKYMTEKVWRGKNIYIEFDYPLSRSVTFIYTRAGGWTLGQVIQKVIDGYQTIYNDDDKPGCDYGIWGHNIGDLVLEGLTISSAKSWAKVRLSVGS